MESCNENCWILIGERNLDLWWGTTLKRTVGLPCSVEFDYNWVLARENIGKKDVVGFYHTHPSFSAHYSSRDDRTMNCWSLSLGRPLVCCFRGTDGLRAWWYLNDEDPPVECQAKSLRGIVFGITPEECIH